MANNKISEYKNQHYVPQRYFRFFSKDDKTIQIFDKENKKHYANAPIKNQCSEDYFLGKNPELEKNITEVENRSMNVLKKLHNSSFDILNDEEYRDLLIYICFQHKRTRHEKNLLNKVETEFSKIVFKHTDGEERFGKEAFNDSLNNLTIDDPRLFIYSLLMSLHSGVLLSDLKKCLLINRTNKKFIFSDSPVVMHNSYFSHLKHKGVGLISPGLQVLYPINEDRAIFLYDNKYYKLKTDDSSIEIYDKRDIDLINLVQMLYCKKLTYFSDILYLNRLLKIRENYDNLFKIPLVEIKAYKPVDKRENSELIKQQRNIVDVKLHFSFLKDNMNIISDNYDRNIERNKEISDFFENTILKVLHKEFFEKIQMQDNSDENIVYNNS